MHPFMLLETSSSEEINMIIKETYSKEAYIQHFTLNPEQSFKLVSKIQL